VECTAGMSLCSTGGHQLKAGGEVKVQIILRMDLSNIWRTEITVTVRSERWR
jgi:hypothetical protein